MPYYCNKCKSVYSSRSLLVHIKHFIYRCHNYNCGGEVYEIDELIFPAIITLNRKGYKTLASCSGHAGDTITKRIGGDKVITVKEPETHVVFAEEIVLPYLPEGYQKTMNVLHKSIHEKSMTVQSELLIKNNLLLLNWARKLPYMTIADNRKLVAMG